MVLVLRDSVLYDMQLAGHDAWLGQAYEQAVKTQAEGGKVVVKRISPNGDITLTTPESIKRYFKKYKA